VLAARDGPRPEQDSQVAQHHCRAVEEIRSGTAAVPEGSLFYEDAGTGMPSVVFISGGSMLDRRAVDAGRSSSGVCPSSGSIYRASRLTTSS
jgi:hypothetical protein